LRREALEASLAEATARLPVRRWAM
jgi:hypothetical protein